MSNKAHFCAVLGILAMAGLGHAARADVKMAPLFTNDMVLQRDKPLPVWGTATAGEKVMVNIGSQKQTTVAGADGAWNVTFQPLPVMQNVRVAIHGQNTIELSNVAVGDVYLCSGQSNMEFGLSRVTNAEEEIAVANYPNVRLMTVPHQITGTRQKSFSEPAEWKVCTPQTVVQGGRGGFSAVAYFFGRELNRNLNIPIGLIDSSWGGTVAQSWMSRETLLKRDDFRAQTLKTEADYATTAPEKPNSPTLLYNGMIAPLEPFALRGVLWYQGESNAGNAQQYRTLFPDLIRDWRTHWNARADGSDMPFYFVQLASFKLRTAAPVQKGWAELRDAQANTLQSFPTPAWPRPLTSARRPIFIPKTNKMSAND